MATVQAKIQMGKLYNSTLKAKRALDKMSPDTNWGLGVAKVINVNYEEFEISLRTVSGVSKTYDRVPMPITFPGAGNRHFFGAMPEIGDLCIVGWMPQESAEKGGGTRTPVILTWLLAGTWPGRDWLTTADFGIDEYDSSIPRDQSMVDGVYANIRRKLRHMLPGNIVASSSQGSDLVLDEGVLLSNRRGNEIRLRDQDQALILRSLQQFHAMAGTRIYGGMVQRDATFLPTTMLSDGKVWDAIGQSENGEPYTDQDLDPNTAAPKGFLSPSLAQARSRITGGTSRPMVLADQNVDPYQFLTRGGFITDSGFALDGKITPDAQYGGKPIYRVASTGDKNTTLYPDQPTLTEYRLELLHTSDGRLPVTEQTDMFDADRIPGSNPNNAPGLLPANVPFLEWVLGSVVGNDPFSEEGRKKYGLPLVAKIFEGGRAAPRLEPAQVNTPIGEHLATLFRLSPPMQSTDDTPGTFWGVNKKGQFKASIGGSSREDSAEIALNGALKLSFGGGMSFASDGHIDFRTKSNSSVNLQSESGQVRIFGGGPPKDNSVFNERYNGAGQGEGSLPAVDIQAKTNARIKAERTLILKAAILEANATRINISGNEELTLDGVKRTSTSTENYQLVVNGKAQESYGGPKYSLPTNFPLHERTYAPLVPGVCEKVTYVLGDREETFKLGNHKTTILVGNLTYQTNLGTWTAQAVQSKLVLGATGMSAAIPTGTISLTASAGTATMSGFAGVTIVANGGTATVRGSTGVYLAAPIVGPDSGPILAAGTLEPFTGLPFLTWGCGAKNHIIGA